jgi:hypothetical protein
MPSKITFETVNNPVQLAGILRDLNTNVRSLITAVNEINTWAETLGTKLNTDVGELQTWAETLAAKLNSDAGVTDADYDATITGDAGFDATITAGQITASVTNAK